jgi:transcriptional regulator with XRE-family HTH domain
MNDNLVEMVREKLQAEVDRGFSITAIARQAKLNRVQLSRFLHRERELPVEQWARLAQVLNVTVSAQLDQTETAPTKPISRGTSSSDDSLNRLVGLCQELDEDEQLVLGMVFGNKEKPLTIQSLADELHWEVGRTKAVVKLLDLIFRSYSNVAD